ncbi:glucokinase [Salegentibacter salinarum]|uniref:Glucokinase n=1 Tax=Salegentibacter salinarum TaxID=447422 RepID=A0A2N0TND6_9FLAO|nr:glucokinase [Salegentibacter salinarum]PKD16244.1 glucokinase [Salegentibacter salinarum]SKB67519.1 glucokinase [Salegentibacter salinarum]
MKTSLQAGMRWRINMEINPELQNKRGLLLAADIGGTNARFAIFNFENGNLSLVRENSYKTKEYYSFKELVIKFCGNDTLKIKSVCIGAAGPVKDGKVLGTNFTWEIDKKDIIDITKNSSIRIINDLEATAYGLKNIESSHFTEIKSGSSDSGNLAILSPGTGLGEAGIFWDGNKYHPIASEGGHCEFSPRNELDIELWRYLHYKYDHVSWERVISGPGIINIYQFLKWYRQVSEPKWFQERYLNEDPAFLISQCAMENTYNTCVETMALFLRFLAIESAQLALKFKATGGIYIGGGIVPKNIQIINKKKFANDFVNSNRMKSLLNLIPIQVILNPNTALLGAAFSAAQNID